MSACYADKAYCSEKHDRLLEELGIENCILKKAKRKQKLSDADKKRNKLCSAIGNGCACFWYSQATPRAGKSRLLGMKRNQTRFMLAAMAYNMKRGAKIASEMGG